MSVRSSRAALRDLADVEAVERTPLATQLPADNVYDALRVAAERYADTPALIWLPQGRASDDPIIYTYERFFAQITRTANLLHELGVRPGRAASCLLPNLPETHFVLWGGATAGQVNPVNPLLTPAQIAEIVTAAGSRTLVTVAPDLNRELYEKAQAVRRLAPDLDSVIAIGAGAIDGPVVRYDEAVARQPADRLLSGRKILPNEVSTYFHTGGTTGAPKLAQQTHWNQVCMSWMFAYAIDCGHGDSFLTGLPLFHANAAIASGLTALASGATVVLAGQNGFRSKDTMADFWHMVERYRISVFSAVPTLLANLLDLPRGSRDVSSLRTCICGAAPLPVSLFKAFEAATGLHILEAYGMTESTLCSTINPRDGERRIGSVGIRLPYHRVKTAVLDADGGFVRDCADDEVGVLLLQGDTVTPGYKQSQYNRKLWPQPGWLNSGDLARRDRNGYFWLTGRAKDLIIRGGHNIDPAVIEEALHRHPAVELAAAVGKPDSHAGEVPVAFVSLRPGMRAEPEELKEFARSNVPERAAAPLYVRIIDKIPTTAVGKIFKPSLREVVVRDTIETALAEAPAGLGGRINVSACHDPTRGLVAQIQVIADASVADAEIRRRTEQSLLRLPVTWDLLIETASSP